MACRTVFFRSVIQTAESCRRPFQTHRNNNTSISISLIRSRHRLTTYQLRTGRKFSSPHRIHHISCSTNEVSSSQDDQGPPQEAVLKVISEVSKAEGRVGQTTNVVIGGTVTNDSTNEWLDLDQKVNSYPTVRDFTAIGTGGDDFVQAMVVAVESVLQEQVPQGRVKRKSSSGGKYVSVSIGPVHVVSSEQVQAVYNAMRRDDRMKYFL